MSLPVIFVCDQCGKRVCNVCYCTGYMVEPVAIVVESVPNSDTLYHQLWHELHTEVRTQSQFDAWIQRVPNFGCGCQSWLKDYVRDNLPPSNLREYGWRLHNAVNAKLSKPEFSWAEFEKKYPNTA